MLITDTSRVLNFCTSLLRPLSLSSPWSLLLWLFSRPSLPPINDALSGWGATRLIEGMMVWAKGGALLELELELDAVVMVDRRGGGRPPVKWCAWGYLLLLKVYC